VPAITRQSLSSRTTVTASSAVPPMFPCASITAPAGAYRDPPPGQRGLVRRRLGELAGIARHSHRFPQPPASWVGVEHPGHLGAACGQPGRHRE